ncbi:hypothetical protein HPB47_018675 [Ixodes persulcatus]|uniref:Uncharacterized protein n=1 Tax=Ixodes persulcatus TaxID=34615 RepID=A0AC60QKA8_IXOPE|nr:hypothetical protein HPB47_018675 [Ixodes persulcatus]
MLCDSSKTGQVYHGTIHPATTASLDSLKPQQHSPSCHRHKPQHPRLLQYSQLWCSKQLPCNNHENCCKFHKHYSPACTASCGAVSPYYAAAATTAASFRSVCLVQPGLLQYSELWCSKSLSWKSHNCCKFRKHTPRLQHSLVQPRHLHFSSQMLHTNNWHGCLQHLLYQWLGSLLLRPQ